MCMILTVQKSSLLLLGDCTRAIPDDEDDAALLSKCTVVCGWIFHVVQTGFFSRFPGILRRAYFK
jgi:hypothetical protein